MQTQKKYFILFKVFYFFIRLVEYNTQIKMSNAAVSELKNKEIDNAIHSEKGRLLNFISSKMPSIEDAEDVLQDVFFEFIETAREAERIEKIASWLYRVARNKITDWYRKRKPERFENKLMNENEEDEPLFLSDMLASIEKTADEKMMLSLFSEQLADALDLLPANQKDVFVMHELEGMKLKQIAENMNIPLKTVISRKHYAVSFLREHLRDLYNELLN
jgi:RNA polymerase sigma factor (sigma-70 family)